MKSYVVIKIEMDGCTVVTPRGRVLLTDCQAKVFSALLNGPARMCHASLIEGYAGLNYPEKLAARQALNGQFSRARNRTRAIGIDIVTIRGWGYRFGEVKSVNARSHVEEPTYSEREALKAIDEGRKPKAVAPVLSDTDRMRIRNLKARGLSLTGIAAMIRKPYAAIAAELGAAR